MRTYQTTEGNVENITIQILQIKRAQLKFVCAEGMFDAISAAHRATGHAAITTVFKDTSEKCANISRSQTETYLQLF